MFRLWYRQRRRVLFSLVYVLAFLFLIINLEFPHALSANPWRFFVGICIFFSMGIVVFSFGALIFITVLPKFRAAVENLTHFMFMMLVASVVFPTYFNIDYPENAWLLFVYLLLYYFMLYGSALDRLRVKVKSKTTRSFVSNRSAEDLWCEMVPTQFDEGSHWNPLLMAVAKNEHTEKSYQLQYAHSRMLVETYNITILSDEPNRHFKYEFIKGLNTNKSTPVSGTYEITIEPNNAGGHKVTLCEEYLGLPAATVIKAWLDDSLGSTADYILAKHKNKRDFSTEGHRIRKILRQIT